MAEPVPTLRPLERQVMEVLWDCPAEVCTRDVFERTRQPATAALGLSVVAVCS